MYNTHSQVWQECVPIMIHLKSPLALEFAGFWRRFGAFIIDNIIISIISSAFVPVHWFEIPVFWNIDSLSGIWWLAAPIIAFSNVLSLLAMVAYFVFFWYWRGQTPGMMIAQIKVIRVDASGVSLGNSIIRFLGLIISTLPLGLGFFWIACDRRKQGWHDKMADTVVVKLPKPPEVTAPQAT
ncbi:RDD family protein [Dehalococcoides mccartyi]|uniref:RDD family protein n=1 Tax=Dehalococcoides mccartyi TaxID=61435 RepID=UPI001EE6C3A8|nr:RDD family protein [Dehalococcoides mccartyi]